MDGWTYVATFDTDEAATRRARELQDDSKVRLDFTARPTDTGRVSLYQQETP